MVTDQNVKEQILSILINNSRKSFRKIAEELEISTTTVSKIINEFENSGAIIGYTVLIDWRKMGYDSSMCLQIKTTPEADIDNVGKELKDVPAVKQIFYITGDATLSAYAVCKDTEEATELLKRLQNVPGVERVIPHTVLNIY